MSQRSAKFAAALVASILAGANFTAVAQNAAKPSDAKPSDAKPTDIKPAAAQTADNCLSAPKGSVPAGSHWRYHLDRKTKSKCWYLGEAKDSAAKDNAAKDSAAKTATAQQQQPAPVPTPDAVAADAAPPQAQPQPQPAMSKSIADAHAEWPSPQATTAVPAPAAPNAQTSGPAATSDVPAVPGDANGQSSSVNTRWLDSSSMAGSNGTRRSAPQPQVVAQSDAQQQQAAPAPAAPVAAEAPPEKTSSSTQMLLIVMIGALALAGLVTALVFRQTRTRTPPYDTTDEWRAPWDSTEPAPPMGMTWERPLRLSGMPPRRAEPPIARRETPRDLDRKLDRTSDRDQDQTLADSQQIAAMLQRLARSTATN
ncbi:hypothetical protein [Bradyrhizobium ivorense]|uniref:hypothetical protein n=1 Tax=Bradyrhizobium ivorense TaxID=2511166 RepID=UPI0010BACFB1|nr:hypothetical protein [Bradyrhizobium ivorense]VIO73547.1 hypothetical protein CI41S_36510 [Bradyrhizobium ivorense]